MDYVKHVIRTKMSLDDSYYNIGFSVDSEIGHFMEKQANRELPYENRFQNSITYECSLSQMFYTRRVYNFLDLLADIGGLFSALGPICLACVSFFHDKSIYHYLVNELFLKRDQSIGLSSASEKPSLR